VTAPQKLPNPANLSFLEQLYAQYAADPQAVPAQWREYFRTLEPDRRAGPVRLRPSFRFFSIFNPPTDGVARPVPAFELQDRVDELVRAYRVRGHRLAALDPLGRPRPVPRSLEPAFYELTEADLDRPFSSRTIHGATVRTLREILNLLQNTYCRSIGVQFMHIDEYEVREWLQRRMEATQNRLKLSRTEQLRILRRLTEAVVFEEFIQKKFVGAKRFSLEGAESLVPLLDLAFQHAADQGVEEIVIGMAHRGRLNLLANVLGKSPRQIFREFEDRDPHLYIGGGDVKYHLGHHGDWVSDDGRRLHLALAFNPSHLEFVNPVVLGRCRAKQDRLAPGGIDKCMALLIHGDAAFAGQGIVQETLNLSELAAYRVGGTLHIIVNNQLGFTTEPHEGRSTPYATDVARMLHSPIFHVNGEDPEAVAAVVRLAMDFRRQFRRDVFIDMYCYRRYGHNEGDEPAFTQPGMYRLIEARKSVRESYLEHLLSLGEITREEADRIAQECRTRLEQELAGAHSAQPEPPPARQSMLGRIWANYRGGSDSDVPEPDTGVDQQRLVELLEAMTRLPQNFHPLRKIRRLLDLRREMARGLRPLDWATAEALAFATLATQKVRVRLTGQDSARGTFSQRHAILFDSEDDHPYCPLAELAPDQAPVEICNSPLSEAAVLGFEYGYSIGYPDALVIWEAQFGDFCNVAQVYVDQFIVSAEAKWRSLSGLVLLLPHGLEGQGPEHSSARLERFLNLCVQDNIQVAVPTTPAQYFHLLRRQVLRPWRKPLIVLTPKSLLRHPRVVSPLSDLAEGRFRRILPDELPRKEPPSRVLLCSGKIYYELEQERRDRGRSDVAIVRLEQLYPLPATLLEQALADVPDGTPVLWVQEEPENMGAWRHIQFCYAATALRRVRFGRICRPESSSPASGSAAAHQLEQQALLAQAFESNLPAYDLSG
jgi:2-oxoglutarate dehydrogenase E1 component